MRAVIQAFSKGQCGSHYLFADVERIEGLKSWECTAREFQHSSSQTDVCKQGAWTLCGEEFLAEGSGRHEGQDEAKHDEIGNDNGRTTAVLAP